MSFVELTLYVAIAAAVLTVVIAIVELMRRRPLKACGRWRCHARRVRIKPLDRRVVALLAQWTGRRWNSTVASRLTWRLNDIDEHQVLREELRSMKNSLRLAAAVMALPLTLVSPSAMACNANGNCENAPGHNKLDPAPAPIAGAGLPVLIIAGAAYWAVRRYRRKTNSPN